MQQPHATCMRELQLNVTLRPQRPYGLLGPGRPGRPLRLSHCSCSLTDCVQIRCCFTSTETERTARDWGGQDVHLDFHTAPELCRWGGNWPCFILCCQLECSLRCPFNTTFRSRWPLYLCTTWQRLLHYVKRRYAYPLCLLLLLLLLFFIFFFISFFFFNFFFHFIFFFHFFFFFSFFFFMRHSRYNEYLIIIPSNRHHWQTRIDCCQ